MSEKCDITIIWRKAEPKIFAIKLSYHYFILKSHSYYNYGSLTVYKLG